MLARALLLAAALAAPALAQSSVVTFEGSLDGGATWSGGTIPYAPGNTIIIRARISLINAGTNTLLGLAGITFQPKLTNFTPAQGDMVLPFTRDDGGAVPENPQSNVGRIAPFAASGMNTGSNSGLLTAHVDPGNILRFAGAIALTQSTNLAWGVASGQLPLALAGTNFRAGLDPVVFRYAVRLNSVATNTEWLATVDLDSIVQQRATWYRVSGPDPLLAPVTQDSILPLRIVIPAPGPTAVALVGLTLCLRRKRA
jgi:hypothetical protein